MKFQLDKQSKLLVHIYWGQIIILVLLGVLILAGTTYGLLSRTKFQNHSVNTVVNGTGEGQTFKGIGMLRIPTSDPNPGIAIIYVSFVYYPEDKAFSEELAFRVKDFRQIIAEYISSFSVAELQMLDEDNIKRELLRRINTILRLGQIEVLYFTDFMVLE